MKLKHLSVALGLLAFGTFHLTAQPNSQGLVVHEWGTFTSVQGGEGVPLTWKPLQSSQLPGFVYDWKHPGLGRISTSMLPLFSKGDLTTLQRMETPVIYFYANYAQTVDMTVKFPGGLITEWYPQATQIGPSRIPSQPEAIVPSLDTKSGEVEESMIRWSNLQILPNQANQEIAQKLRTEAAGSHYFAARETDSAYIRQDPLSTANPESEHEKFLFYRGAGSFATPLRVTMKSDDAVTVANTGKDLLSHLFVLAVNGKSGHFVYLPELQPGEEKTVLIKSLGKSLPVPQLAEKISAKMSSSLVKSGLYAREASAMVNTWKDSWFAEQGMRVLYVLPRAWTDSTLPMNLSPTPTQLVRVMVGRSEVLTPGMESELTLQLDKAKHGDEAASQRAHQLLVDMGRFAPTAFSRAILKVKTQAEEQTKLWALLSAIQKPE